MLPVERCNDCHVDPPMDSETPGTGLIVKPASRAAASSASLTYRIPTASSTRRASASAFATRGRQSPLRATSAWKTLPMLLINLRYFQAITSSGSGTSKLAATRSVAVLANT